MNQCSKLVNNGMIIRYIITLISFYILSINVDNTFIRKYIYLILPILLTILDEVDNIFTFLYKNNSCTKLFYYQYTDKICDSISYLFLFLFFKIDNLLLFFTLYRIIGVILFIITKNSRWLILFFDFSKEYLFYFFIFKNNYLYLPMFIFCKFCFEFYYHTIHNKNLYK